jgi:peptidoglycan hydrolase-like protein with peptidoglycan-binding domain
VRRTTGTARPQRANTRHHGAPERPRPSPETSGNWLIDLQQSAGNTAVQRALASPQDQQPTLRLGSSGPAVSSIQQLLNALGARPKLATDGVFGHGTQSAVTAFQSTQGLAADGVVGPRTREALESPAASPSASTTTSQSDLGAPLTTKGSGPVTFATFGTPTAEGRSSPEAEGADLMLLAEVQFDEGDAAGALPKFQRVYGLPRQPARQLGLAAMFIAECHHKLGNFQEAIKFYQEVLVSAISAIDDPQVFRMATEGLREARAGQKLGDLRLETVTPQEQAAENATAQQELNAAIVAKDPQTRLAHATRAYNQRAALFKLRSDAAVEMGDAFTQLKQFDKALDMYQEALAMPLDKGPVPQPSLGKTKDEIRDRMRVARVRQAGDKGGALEAPPMSEAEKVALFDAAGAKINSGDVRGAADDFMRLYAQKNLTLNGRAAVLFNLARSHQLLQDFGAAISEFEEFLVSPNSLGKDAVVRQRIEQCRLKQIGTLLQQGGAGDAFLFEGDVLFETGEAGTPGEPAGDTISELANTLREKHAGTPGSRFSVTFIGHASNRFKSAKSTEEADRRNRELSRQRAEKVKQLLLAQLPAADVAAGVYRSILDAEGDSEAKSLGLGAEDNSWEFRRVRIVVKNA